MMKEGLNQDVLQQRTGVNVQYGVFLRWRHVVENVRVSTRPSHLYILCSKLPLSASSVHDDNIESRINMNRILI